MDRLQSEPAGVQRCEIRAPGGPDGRGERSEVWSGRGTAGVREEEPALRVDVRPDRRHHLDTNHLADGRERGHADSLSNLIELRYTLKAFRGERHAARSAPPASNTLTTQNNKVKT